MTKNQQRLSVKSGPYAVASTGEMILNAQVFQARPVGRSIVIAPPGVIAPDPAVDELQKTNPLQITSC